MSMRWAGWLGSYGGEIRQTTSRAGISPAKSGCPASSSFKRLGVKDDLVHSRHSIETFRGTDALVGGGGHEIGIHGYSHENRSR